MRTNFGKLRHSCDGEVRFFLGVDYIILNGALWFPRNDGVVFLLNFDLWKRDIRDRIVVFVRWEHGEGN